MFQFYSECVCIDKYYVFLEHTDGKLIPRLCDLQICDFTTGKASVSESSQRPIVNLDREQEQMRRVYIRWSAARESRLLGIRF